MTSRVLRSPSSIRAWTILSLSLAKSTNLGHSSSLSNVAEHIRLLWLTMHVSMNFKFYARGHPSISSIHPTTLELTRDTGLSKNGDCIIAVGCSVGLIDLPEPVKNALSSGACRARLTLKIDVHQFAVEGRGAQGLTLSHPTDIVIRKSGFISDRTLMVHADRAAADIPRSFVELLQDPRRKVLVELVAEI
ncbi:DUF371 domain-containing protein [Candidatus Bathyarchaeota archaeon]|nr:MAG: DUF371 domain-containing protein [Candidatus Bathyarchaeota archaeon]